MDWNRKQYLIFSINSQTNTSIDQPINLEIDNKWSECLIESGFIIIRTDDANNMMTIPASFQLLSYSGNRDYIGDNLTANDSVGVFTLEERINIPGSIPNLISFTYKLLDEVYLNNINNTNLKFAIVGRLINPVFPTNNEIFTNMQYKNNLYFANLKWNATANSYIALYLKLKLS